jgi:alpha-L-rhamnosidase
MREKCKSIRKSFLSIAIVISSFFCSAQVTVTNALCENLINPIGLDIAQPKLSWQLVSSVRNTVQTAYEIRVAEDEADVLKGKNLVWNSGKIATDQSLHVEYAGSKLQSAKKYYWQVRVWDNHGKVSAWGEIASWEMGLLQESDWTAKWIESGFAEDTAKGPAPMFRKSFSLGKKVKQARAYITAHGVYEAHINGKRIGDSFLAPGWTSYNKRLQYQVYDVTSLMSLGNNAVSAMVGSGWYRGPLAWEKNKDIYGQNTGLLLQLEITYADGSKETIHSDESWKTSLGAIRSSEIYHGEVYDARLEKKGWMEANFNDSNWKPVVVKEYSQKNLIATYNEPIKRHETFKPIKIFKTPKGETVADFGQNLVGLVQIKVKGNAGDKITIHHAEVLDKEGNFYLSNLRAAKAEIIYTLKGGEVEVYEPHFTFMGFRYVSIEGFPGQVTTDNLSASAFYSDMKETGTFASSNPLVNQLQHNIEWGQKGNFLDVPTDCPQRDERLGWTGDAQVFFRTAAFNRNANNFFSKWMKDVAADQEPDGRVPFVAPNVLKPTDGGSAGWADVATIIPWNMFLVYGDKKILEDQYESMKSWVGFMQQNATNDLWNKGFHFGDWLFYRPEDDSDGRSAITDKYLIAQCFYAHSTQLLINAATVLNKTADVQSYTILLKKVKAAFEKEYLTPSGRLVSSSQTAYVLALNFDMLPEPLRAQAAERLVKNIKDYGTHLTTGFLGTPYLCHVLTRFGYTDVAYSLLLQETYPSWLYPVKMGATTIWERWDGQKPDGSFQTPSMNSFNHYAYGAIGDWMYRVTAGIDTDESAPGYKRIIIKPHLGGDFKEVQAAFQSNYGKVSSSWKLVGKDFQLNVEIPANTTATISLPANSQEGITENSKPVTEANGWKVRKSLNGRVEINIGSGAYRFSSKVD